MTEEISESSIEICLRCYSDSQNAESLSELVGFNPTIAFNKGDRIYGKTGKPYGLRPRTGWLLKKSYTDCPDLSETILDFIKEYNISSNFVKTAREAAFIDIEIFIGIFGFDDSHDFWIDAKLCKILSKLSIDFGWSNYCSKP